MLRSLAALASAAVVLALPMGALAMVGRGDGGSSYALPTPTNYLLDGKYLQQAPAPAAVDVVSTPQAGFDYGDAAIGAAVGALVVVIVGGTVLVVRFEHNGRHGHAVV
jgi:hypothetical protein